MSAPRPRGADDDGARAERFVRARLAEGADREELARRLQRRAAELEAEALRRAAAGCDADDLLDLATRIELGASGSREP